MGEVWGQERVGEERRGLRAWVVEMEGLSDRLGTDRAWRHCSQRLKKSIFMLLRNCVRRFISP